MNIIELLKKNCHCYNYTDLESTYDLKNVDDLFNKIECGYSESHSLRCGTCRDTIKKILNMQLKDLTVNLKHGQLFVTFPENWEDFMESDSE